MIGGLTHMNNKLEIPIEELMAEKLGIITLCVHCGKRIYIDFKYIDYVWIHEGTDSHYCSMAYKDSPMYAKPKSEDNKWIF